MKIPHCQASWTWLNPLPQGNSLYTMKFLNAITGYVGGGAGTILRTINSGNNWSVLPTYAGTDVHSISIVNQNVIYAAGNDVVIKTTDAGLSWSLFTTPYFNSGSISSVFFLNQNTGYVGGGDINSQKIIKTTNGGLNWIILTTPYPYVITTSLYFFNPDTGFAAANSMSNLEPTMIQKTTDGGITWIINYQASSTLLFSLTFVNNLTGYAVGAAQGSGGRILKSTDSGTNWYAQVSGTNSDLYSISYLDSNNLVASGTSGTVIKTTNGGNEWLSTNTGTTTDLYSVSITSGGNFYACGFDGALLKSSNSGGNWSFSNSGYYEDIFDSYFLNMQTGYVVGANGRFLKTVTSGSVWIPLNTGFSYGLYSVYFTDYNTGYAGEANGLIIKTTNSGLNWISQSTGQSTPISKLFFVNAYTGYAATGNRILYTSDGGNSWITRVLPGTEVASTMYFFNAETGCVGNGVGLIFRTTDSGSSWYLVSTLGDGLITDMDFGSYNIGYAVDGHRVIKTTDSGNTWFLLPLVPEVGPQKVDFVNASTGFIAGLTIVFQFSEVAVCKTKDGGANWTRELPGARNSPSSIFAVSPDECFITGNRGLVMRRQGSVTSINSNGNKLSEKFMLYQNYPNPFNPSTRIKFAIPVERQSDASLRIYDILGREVATLVNRQLKPGTYEVEWDATNFPSGVYYYKLVAGDYTQTKKMVLLK